MPLFNKFTPLTDRELDGQRRARCSRAAASESSGLFVMDGSKRSATATPTSPASARRSASCSSTRWCRACSPRRSKRCSRTSWGTTGCTTSWKAHCCSPAAVSFAMLFVLRLLGSGPRRSALLLSCWPAGVHLLPAAAASLYSRKHESRPTATPRARVPRAREGAGQALPGQRRDPDPDPLHSRSTTRTRRPRAHRATEGCMSDLRCAVQILRRRAPPQPQVQARCSRARPDNGRSPKSHRSRTITRPWPS